MIIKYKPYAYFWLSKKYFTVRKQLSTYLEILSPNEIYNAIEKKERTVTDLINKIKIEQPTQQLGKQISKHLIKNVKHLKAYQINDLIEVCGTKDTKILKPLYQKIISNLILKVEAYNIYDLIDIIYVLAKVNKRQPEFMKLVEDRIICEKIKINHPILRKILFAYTHLNMGTATLYTQITRVIKIGQHEFNPIHIAEFAYYLSKVQQNAKGGFGIFKLAELHLAPILKVQTFSELVEISHFMIMQNLGSNQFQLQLQETLYNKFPFSADLKINQLVKLLKSTSGYYFKFKDGALLQTLENFSIQKIKYCTLSQADEVLWSWGRSTKGGIQLWKELEKYFEQKIQLLKPRQLAFAYYSFSRSAFISQLKILQKLEQKFSQLQSKSIPIHYYVKFMLGMHKRRNYNMDIFKKFSQVLIEKIEKLTAESLLSFLVVINESDIYYQSQGIDLFKKAMQSCQTRIESLIPYYKISQLCQILYLWVKLNIESETFIKKIIVRLEDVSYIPKKSFLKTIFSFVIKDEYKLVLNMLPIIYELRNYGPIGYFFSPYQYPLLAYTIYHLKVNGRIGKSPIEIERWLLSEIKQYFFQIEKRTLNDFVIKVYDEAKTLIEKQSKL